MIAMKRILLIVLITAGAGHGFAQTSQFKAKLNRSDEPVYITIDQVSATVQGYDGDEIIIQAIPSGPVATPSAAQGLKRIAMPGRDKEDNIIRPRLTEDPSGIRITIPPGNFSNLSIRVPRSIVLFMRANMNLNEGKISIHDINSIDLQGTLSTVDVSKVTNFVVLGGGVHLGSRANGKITISDVTWTDAPVMVNGRATHRTYMVSSTNGDIDLTVAETAKADLIFASEFGQVFSDLNVKPVEASKEDVTYIKDFFSLKPSVQNLQLNGGGVNVIIDSLYGNIFIRKQ
jgi:hypothetical protein